jgi:anti-sigma B factor antagonist
MELSLTTTDDKSWSVLTLSGEFDTLTASDVRDKVAEVVGQNDAPHILIDLREVTFMDSSALGVLVGALRTARSLGGEVRIIGPNDKLVPLFKITGLNRTFATFETIETAAAAPLEQLEADPG